MAKRLNIPVGKKWLNVKGVATTGDHEMQEASHTMTLPVAKNYYAQRNQPELHEEGVATTNKHTTTLCSTTELLQHVLENEVETK